MKILMPIYSNKDQLDRQKITGGIEMFCLNILDVNNEIIPLVINKEKGSFSKNKLYEELEKNNCSGLLVNEAKSYLLDPFLEKGIKTVLIFHEPLKVDVRFLEFYKKMMQFIEAGGVVYFVSQKQFDFHRVHIKRITGKNIENHNAFVNPAFANEHCQTADENDYDALTLGRTDITKDPFFVHRKLSRFNLKTCVLTDSFVEKNEKQDKYYHDNLKWSEPQFTFRGLSYQENLKKLARASVFISTTSVESWGIAALEALSCGVPLILVTDKSLTHSSFAISPLKKFVCCIPKTASDFEFYSAVVKMKFVKKIYSKEISELTKQKHSKENFKLQIEGILKRMYE